MKKVNRSFIFLVQLTCWLCLSLLQVACSDFLEETDKSNYTQDNYFTEPSHAETVVNAIYQDLRPLSTGLNYGGMPAFMLEFPTGLANTEAGQNVENQYLRNLVNNSDNAYGENWWITSYRAIGNANLAIQKIPGIPMDETEKQKLLGEAHFLRAFFYYHLVRIFGDVPLITEPQDLAAPDFYPGRTPQQQIYDLIVADLTAAENSGLPSTDASGRVSVGAVKSLLASCYLTMAGYPLQMGNQYYELAANKAGEVIQSSDFRLFDRYDDLHNPVLKNTGEHIFMTQYAAGIINNTFQDLFLPNNRDISSYANESGGLYANEAFIRTYDPNDKRIQEQQFYFTRFTLHNDRTREVQFGAYYIFKYFDRDANLNVPQSGLNWPLLRYAEVLLIYAEAKNEIEGGDSDAVQVLNQIRRRAALPDLVNPDQENLRKAIWMERYHELAYENKTWFDMVRTRKVLNLETLDFDDFIGHKLSYGPVLRQRDLLFPIPTREVRNNNNLIQNEGY